MLKHDVLDLGGRYVFALPAIGIAQPVDKLHMTKTDITQQITGVEVPITLFEHVTEDHFLVFLRIGVAIQRCFFIDLRQQQPLPSLPDPLHEAISVTGRRATFMGVLHQRPGLKGKANGVVEVEDIGEADIAIAGSVQFADMVDSEAIFERGPDPGTQTIADHLAHGVVRVVILLRLVHQIAAQFADITNGGRLEPARIIPELTGTELAPNRKTRSPAHRRAPAHIQAGSVIQRQGAINNVVRLHIQRDHAETTVGFHPATVLEDSGLGQTGGAGRVDIKARIIEVDALGGYRVFRGFLSADPRQIDVALRGLPCIPAGVLIGDEEGFTRVDGDLGAHGIVNRHQLLADDNRQGFHQIQAVHQHTLSLRGVEHRAHAADFGHGQHMHQ